MIWFYNEINIGIGVDKTEKWGKIIFQYNIKQNTTVNPYSRKSDMFPLFYSNIHILVNVVTPSSLHKLKMHYKFLLGEVARLCLTFIRSTLNLLSEILHS